jgi:hypothetical protein
VAIAGTCAVLLPNLRAIRPRLLCCPLWRGRLGAVPPRKITFDFQERISRFCSVYTPRAVYWRSLGAKTVRFYWRSGEIP